MAQQNQQMTTDDLLTHLGVTDADQRQTIIEDLMPQPDGVKNLTSETTEDVKSTCIHYSRRAAGSFIIPRVVIKRIVALVLWIKDQHRLGLEPFISQGLARDEIIANITASLDREELRSQQRKIGETVLSQDFQVKLKSQGQWNKWIVELQAALNVIIGANGSPISYVIRKEEAPAIDMSWSYAESAINLSPLNGPKFEQDARTVHQLILKNIHEDSDAYAYIKPHLRKEDGRKDIMALRDRYESNATQQTLINTARATLASLRYKSERAFSFEKFSARLQSALDDLEYCGRPEVNGNIVDSLWQRIQAAELQNFLAALKVDYTRNPRNYREILHDIAAEVANLKPAGTAFVSEVATAPSTGKYTNAGSCPDDGVHTNGGKVFIGSYAPKKWNSPSVKPFHDEIRNARGNNGSSPPSRNHKRRIKAVQRQNSKIAKLTAKVEELESARNQPREITVASAQTTIATEPTASSKGSTAGTGFGGKSSMKKAKGDGG